VGKICFVLDFILHSAYTVDARALSSTLPSLSLKDMIFFTADSKSMAETVRGIGVYF